MMKMGPEANKTQQGTSPTSDEELRRKVRYLDEGPERWGSHNEEIKAIDLTASDPETDEDDDFNNKDNEDSLLMTMMRKILKTVIMMN